MVPHRFKVGQDLAFNASRAEYEKVTGLYEVTRLLPSDGAELQYRIRNKGGGQERVVRESQLRHP